MTTLSKNWCIHNEIIKRVNKESLVEWCKKEDSEYLPKYEPVKINFTPATLYIFSKNFIRGIMP